MATLITKLHGAVSRALIDTANCDVLTLEYRKLAKQFPDHDTVYLTLEKWTVDDTPELQRTDL